MSVSSLSIATSSSLPLSNKISTNTNPSFECCSLNSIPSQFKSKSKSKPKPTLSLKIKTHFYSYYPSFSLLSPPLLSLSSSSTFDTVQVTEDENEEEYENEEEEDGDEDEDEIESQSGDVGRLYVGNLPYAMTSSQLSDVFAEAGRVLTVQIVYDRVTDRSRGFGFVTMGSVEEAKEAIRMFDGSQVGGRTVKVNFPEVPKGGEREVMGPKIQSSYQGFIDTPHKLYASNLSWSLTSQALREAFEDQPGLLSTKVIYDRDSGRSRGFGFITFSSAEQVGSALDAMNGVELEGRPLLLKLAEQKASPSPLPRTPEREYGNGIDSS